ncbi:hypothetical protein IWZ03DRAFT_158201 [Phyllosticta citriasiana]|uniref:Uncharacterized protein n=1 Tax=Phyllosticta citriasiana TaxID=595635 RepID=A0ABR1KPJ4_9PEZI
MSHGQSSSSGYGPSMHPASSKSRRAMARSDEEVEENIVEENFRVGWPILQPLPTKFVECDSQEEEQELVTDWEQASNAIHNILTSQSVDIHRFRLGRQRTAGTSSLVPLVHVLAYNKNSGRASWHNAVLRLARSLENFVVNDVQIHVEIVEYGYPRILPAATEDAPLDIWSNTIAPQVMGILARGSMLWQSMSLVRLSSAHHPDDSLSVLIEAADVFDPAWGNVRPEIASDLRSTSCKLAVWQMQAVEGLGGRDPNTRNLHEDRWGPIMYPGDGIAPEEVEDSTGTVGGFVHLQSQDWTTNPHILTNFHVIKTPSLEESLRPYPLRSMCLPRGSSPYPVKIPSHFDTSQMLKNYSSSLQSWHEYIHDRRGGRPSLVEKAEMGITLARLELEKAEKRVAEVHKCISQVDASSKRPAGAVRATSGYQHVTFGEKKFPLDWALIEVEPSRLINCLPPAGSYDNTLVQENFVSPPWSTQQADEKWTRFPKASSKVVKLGRMTGWTAARLGRPSCFWRSLAKDDDEVGDWYDQHGTVVECLQVFSHYEGETTAEPFAAGGDSGSVVRDFYTGAWIGLLFGAHPSGWALATPMEAVIHSIEEVTGEKVVNPAPMD